MDSAKPANPQLLLRKDSTMGSGRCDDTPTHLKRSLMFAVPLDITALCYSKAGVASMCLELLVLPNAEHFVTATANQKMVVQMLLLMHFQHWEAMLCMALLWLPAWLLSSLPMYALKEARLSGENASSVDSCASTASHQ